MKTTNTAPLIQQLLEKMFSSFPEAALLRVQRESYDFTTALAVKYSKEIAEGMDPFDAILAAVSWGQQKQLVDLLDLGYLKKKLARILEDEEHAERGKLREIWSEYIDAINGQTDSEDE